MRFLTGTLLFTAALLLLLLGASYLLSSSYTPVVPPFSVEKMPATAKPPAPAPSSGRQMFLGIMVLALAGAGVTSGFLAIFRRARPVILTVIGASLVGLLLTVLVDRWMTVVGVALALLVLALGGALLSRPRGAPATDG